MTDASLAKNYPVFCDPIEIAQAIVDWRCPENARDIDERIAELHGAIHAALETRGRKHRRRPSTVPQSIGVSNRPTTRNTLTEHLATALRAGASIDDLISFADPVLWEMPTEGEVRVYLGGMNEDVFCSDDELPTAQNGKLVEATFDVRAYATFAKSLATQSQLGQAPTIVSSSGAIILRGQKEFEAEVNRIEGEIDERFKSTAMFASIGGAPANAASIAIANRIVKDTAVPKALAGLPGLRCFLPGLSSPIGAWLMQALKGPVTQKPDIQKLGPVGSRSFTDYTSSERQPVGVVAMRVVGSARQIFLLIAGIDMAGTLLASEAFATGRLSRHLRECDDCDQTDDTWVWRSPRNKRVDNGPAADDLVGVQAVYTTSEPSDET